MIGLRIAAADLSEIESGAPLVILAPGTLLPYAPPLVPLVLRDGVLARLGAEPARTLPLPAWVRPLALIAPPHLAESLRPLLPAGLPVLPDPTGLPALLAEALREASAARDDVMAERDRLKRALATLDAPRPRLALDIPAGGGTAGLPLTQPLGRPAEGLCTIELHVAAAGTVPLRARLLAGSRVVGSWHVPVAAISPGPLALDLPEPAPPGDAEAVLQLLAPEAGDPPLLGTASDGSLALRAWAAPPGWSVLPRFLDWSAIGAVPALPLPLSAADLGAAEAENATAALVAIGEDAPRLTLTIPPAREAWLRLPPVPTGATDLVRARITADRPVALSVHVSCGTEVVASGWRDAGPATDISLALPPGPMAAITIAFRHDGPLPASVELSGLTLQAGAAGERRAVPSEVTRAAPAITTPAITALAPMTWRAAPPAPRLTVAGPGGAPAPHAPPPGATTFEDLTVNQHLANPDGTYRHLDVTLSGLVSGAGLWRQVRTKLFERRGIAGLEFREAKGWPQMFDSWPSGTSDAYGPFWRLETEAVSESLAAVATPHDRALISALLAILPDIAGRAARRAGVEPEPWAACARRLAAAVAETGTSRIAI